MEVLKRFVNLHYGIHLSLAFIIRLILIAYAVYHDSNFMVPYTDIDYKVFTDAARYVLAGGSPYDRKTYRYSPLLAIILTPNIFLHELFGKILFSIFDLLVAILIQKIVVFNLNQNLSSNNKFRSCEKKFTANYCMLFWLYNPLTIAIATRGNCDSIAGLLVLTTIYFVQCKGKSFVAGLVHGLSIHFRLYPIFYSLTLYMFLSSYSVNSCKTIATRSEEKRTIFKKKYLMYLVPNVNQFLLVFGCLMSLYSLIGTFYYVYGYEFLFETYLYHFIRHDTRHNFSLYFYLQYLTEFIKNVPIWQKILTSLPQFVLIVVLSFKYGLNKVSMNFGILSQTLVMVSYNTVLTSQYFVWVFVILTICLWQIRIPIKSALFWISVWFLSQVAWLLPAYLLEFKGQNTFIFIWLQSVAFFCANIAILGRIITNFQPYEMYRITKKN